MILGYVYVVTSANYHQRSIFKIGFTTNLTKRLKLFNATRMDDDLFYCVRNWRTTHYSKLEAFLHTHLHEYRKKNEFFQVNLDLIEEGVKLYADTNGAYAFHEDVVLIKGEHVKWLASKRLFILDNDNHGRGTNRITCVSELEMRPVILSWLDCVDKHGLTKFMSNDSIDRLICILIESKCKDNEDEILDLSADFKKLNF